MKSFESDYLGKKGITLKWKKNLVRSLKNALNKSVYKNYVDLEKDLIENLEEINSKRDKGRAVKLFLRYANLIKFLTDEEYLKLSNLIKVKKDKPDIYIPTKEEIENTLSKLPETYKIVYQAILFSGLRGSEIQHLINHRKNLKVQHRKGYVKVLLNWKRGSKNSYFGYLPYPIYEKLPKRFKLSALQSYIKKHNLLPIKYLRKYFYSKGLEMGIPSEVLDFYQGRSPKTIGAMHYVRLESLGDGWYTLYIKKLNSFKMKTLNP